MKKIFRPRGAIDVNACIAMTCDTFYARTPVKVDERARAKERRVPNGGPNFFRFKGGQDCPPPWPPASGMAPGKPRAGLMKSLIHNSYHFVAPR